MKKYETNTYQKKLIKIIKHLPQENLIYLTFQQDKNQPNLTLPEFRKLINRGIKEYYKRERKYLYKEGSEKEVIKYVAIFETTKNFNISMKSINPKTDKLPYMGIHCHLFLTHLRGYGLKDYLPLINSINISLTSLKHKKECIKEFGLIVPKVLDENFIKYHVKQQIVPSNMVMFNV